jgi:uncharacterized protein YggU (UPF0235/DUF167 family)
MPAIRFIATKGKVLGGTFQLICHVKPGVNASREGIAAVSDEAIEVCVAAQAREGEANKAVREVIAEAKLTFKLVNLYANCTQVLKLPKSDVEVVKGVKSREKTVAIHNVFTKNTSPKEEVERIRAMLRESVVN